MSSSSDEKKDKVPESGENNNPITKIRRSQKKEVSFFRSQTNSYVKYFFLKWSNTRLASNLDHLSRFQKIYNHLITNKLPILKGGERRKKAKRTE